MCTTSCSLPLPGDVCRFDLSRIPLTCLASSGPDIYHSPEDVVEWQGVAWGTDAMGMYTANTASIMVTVYMCIMVIYSMQ